MLRLLLLSAVLATTATTRVGANAGVLEGLYTVDGTTTGKPVPYDGIAKPTPYENIRFDSVAALDGDQRTVLARLAGESFAGMALARSVFENGAYSESYAILTIDSDEFLSRSVPANTAVSGMTETGEPIAGIAVYGSPPGNNTLVVHYPTTTPDVVVAAGGGGPASPTDEDEHPGGGGGRSTKPCRVGGNPSPDTSGCFSSTGTLTLILDAPTQPSIVSGHQLAVYYDYSYNVLLHNSNALSLATLRGDRNEPHNPTFQKFVDYYGSSEYDNDWIRAAFEGRKTPGFATGDGSDISTDVDFSALDFEGRHAALKWGMVVLKLWSFVVESTEEAVRVCDGAAAPSPSIDRWDRAVAAYTGSGPIASAPSNPDEGYFLYNLVEAECRSFGTCPQTTGAGNKKLAEPSMAPLNEDVFAYFWQGRNALSAGDCQTASQTATLLTEKLTVPLVQGLLRNVHAIDLQDRTGGWTNGQAKAFATALLPLVHGCNTGNAYVILEDLLKRDSVLASFEVIKDTVERSYSCLGVTCGDVGGLLAVNGNGSTDYERGAEPCGMAGGSTGGSSSSTPEDINDGPSRGGGSSSKRTSGLSNEDLLIVGVSIGAGLVALVAAVGYCFWEYKKRRRFDSNIDGVTSEVARVDSSDGPEQQTRVAAAAAADLNDSDTDPELRDVQIV